MRTLHPQPCVREQNSRQLPNWSVHTYRTPLALLLQFPVVSDFHSTQALKYSGTQPTDVLAWIQRCLQSSSINHDQAWSLPPSMSRCIHRTSSAPEALKAHWPRGDACFATFSPRQRTPMGIPPRLAKIRLEMYIITHNYMCLNAHFYISYLVQRINISFMQYVSLCRENYFISI